MQPLHYQDFTLKAKVDDLIRIEQQLIELQATFHGHDYQTDYYFRTAKGKLKYRAGKIEKLITHYERIFSGGLEETIVYRYDLNPTEAEIQKLLATQTQIGIVKKERKIFFIDDIKIHLDTLEDGKHFIEIEAIDREKKWTTDHLKNKCLELQMRLKIPDTDLIPTGYLKSTALHKSKATRLE
jgi:adenylate cyclase class IV